MKPVKQNIKAHAKTTLAFAVCILVCAAGLQADDDKSSKQAQGTPGSSSSSSSKGASSSSATAGESGSSSQLSAQDQKFIKDAAKGGKKEIHMGQMGVQKASNEQVKAYAQRLLDDHTKASADLKQLASSKGITLPNEQNAGTSTDTDRSKVREKTDDAQHDAHMKKLHTLTGAEFDREFVRMAVQDHEKDVKEFEKAAQRAQDSEVKAFAQKTAPILREHLQQAKALQSQVGGSTATGSAGSGSGQESSSGSRNATGNTGGNTSSGTGATDDRSK